MMTDRAGESPADNAIPIAYRGLQFPSRQALADHLAPLVGKTRSTMRTLLSRYDGDVERALASRRPSRGRSFPHRKALAQYLAPRLHVATINSASATRRCGLLAASSEVRQAPNGVSGRGLCDPTMLLRQFDELAVQAEVFIDVLYEQLIG
jgi:hypothetical protein